MNHNVFHVIVKLTFVKDFSGSKHPAKCFHRQTFESKKLFMHETFQIFLRVGVRSWMLQPEMLLVPAFTLLNVNGFYICVKILRLFGVFFFSTNRHCIQLKLSHVTSIVSFLIINQRNINQKQKVTVSLKAFFNKVKP